MDSTRLVVQARDNADATCPYCKDHFAAGAPALACEGCQTTYHEDCLRALGRCSTLGCPGTRALPRVSSASAPLDAPARSAGAPPRGAWSLARGAAFALTASASLGLAGVVANETWRALVEFPPPPTEPAVVALMAAILCAAIAIALYVAPAGAGPVAAAAARVAPISADPCPACASSFAPGERLLACEGCGGRYHPACLRGLGRCAGATCTGRRAVPARAR